MVGQAKVGLSTFALKDKVMSLFCPCHDKEIHTVPRLLLLSWGCFFCILGTLGQQVWRHSRLPLVWEGLFMAISGWTEGMPLRTLRSRRALQRHLSELHTAPRLGSLGLLERFVVHLPRNESGFQHH